MTKVIVKAKKLSKEDQMVRDMQEVFCNQEVLFNAADFVGGFHYDHKLNDAFLVEQTMTGETTMAWRYQYGRTKTVGKAHNIELA